MKRLLAIPAMVLLTLPLAGEEAKAPKTAPKTIAEPAANAPAESPLVAAARKTRRGAGKSIVITDDSVKKSKGHVTSTTIVYTPPAIPEKAAEPADVVMLKDRTKKQEETQKTAATAKAAEEKKQKELARRARLAENAENAEEGLDDGVDPAQLERDLAAEAKKP
jgi:hypothetical protein